MYKRQPLQSCVDSRERRFVPSPNPNPGPRLNWPRPRLKWTRARPKWTRPKYFAKNAHTARHALSVQHGENTRTVDQGVVVVVTFQSAAHSLPQQPVTSRDPREILVGILSQWRHVAETMDVIVGLGKQWDPLLFLWRHWLLRQVMICLLYTSVFCERGQLHRPIARLFIFIHSHFYENKAMSYFKHQQTSGGFGMYL